MSVKKVGILSTLFLGAVAAVGGGAVTYELNTPQTYQAQFHSLSAQEAETLRRDKAVDSAALAVALTTGILAGAAAQRKKQTPQP